MTYGDFKDLTGRTTSEKILCDKAFNIAKNPKHDRNQWGLASMIHKLFYKKSSGSGIKNQNISNKQLAEKLQKPIIRKFKNRKAYSSFIDNICGADITDIQLISKLYKGFKFILCVIDIYSKHAQVILLKEKRGITITNLLYVLIMSGTHFSVNLHSIVNVKELLVRSRREI